MIVVTFTRHTPTCAWRLWATFRNRRTGFRRPIAPTHAMATSSENVASNNGHSSFVLSLIGRSRSDATDEEGCWTLALFTVVARFRCTYKFSGLPTRRPSRLPWICFTELPEGVEARMITLGR